MANSSIGDITFLKREPYTEEALSILHRVSAQVRPVMQSRGWRVGRLREFYPKDAQLLGLNINRGEEIRLRLRSPYNPAQFLQYTDILGTMLHELAHIVHGPHDEKFYRLLDELKRETEALMIKGYTGDGFYSTGHRVGLGQSHNVPRHQVRAKTLEAIEARQKSQRFSGPPRTLATVSSDWKRLEAFTSPVRMAAMAAERRLKDQQRCGGLVLMPGTTPKKTPDTRSNSNLEGTRCIVIPDSDSDADADNGPEQPSQVLVID
ncbi:hypothetical protein GGI12_002852 [Dipsacomyces acuminosporus]|nr:hypothetical protein GGI12_002852 [Dipsacomyces acuminosporus]